MPSRLYHQPTPLKPLAGKRVSIKDVFDLAGTVTTLSSRDFAALYDVREDNADYVQKLISLGVVIVGKTKTTSFASSDEPTDQWVDFHCPTNPRGDKYQSPSGSTTGGAAALAGYSWLDASIGTDSKIVPSTVQARLKSSQLLGVFELPRPPTDYSPFALLSA